MLSLRCFVLALHLSSMHPTYTHIFTTLHNYVPSYMYTHVQVQQVNVYIAHVLTTNTHFPNSVILSFAFIFVAQITSLHFP